MTFWVPQRPTLNLWTFLSTWACKFCYHVQYVLRNVQRLRVGLPPFKSRFNNHTKSFHNTRKRLLYKAILPNWRWKLKMDKRDFSVKWSILKRASSYKSGDKRCNLCLEEKMCIMKADPNDLNKRTENFSKYHHRNRHLQCNMKPMPHPNNVNTASHRHYVRNFMNGQPLRIFLSVVWRSSPGVKLLSNNEYSLVIFSYLCILCIFIYIHTYKTFNSKHWICTN